MNRWLRKLALRKLLALLATLWCLGMSAWAFWVERDIPAGIAGLLQALVVTAIGGYCGSSAVEAIKGKTEDEK